MRQAPTALVTEAVAYPGSVQGSGPIFLIKDTGQEALLAARTRLRRFRVDAAEKPFEAGGVSHAAGSWILAEQPGLGAALKEVAESLSLGIAFHRDPGAALACDRAA